MAVKRSDFIVRLYSQISSAKINMSFSLALYVWFVSMTTIGFGDYVPQGRSEGGYWGGG